MTASASTLSVFPAANSDAEEYSIEVEVSYLTESKIISSFTVTVLVNEEEDESSSSSGVALGFDGVSILVNFDYEFKAKEEMLEVAISRVTQTGIVFLEFSKMI